LLVDGYVKDLFSTGLILQRLEYDVHIVNSAEDAEAIMEAMVPELLITELSLPRASGLELLMRIKKSPRTKGLPVIIHTATDDKKKEEYCLSMGCAAYLKKPVDPETLFRAIQHATESKPRNNIRLRTLLPVMVGGQSFASGHMSTEYVSDLSENGIYVRTMSPRPLKSVLPVTIIIANKPIKARAIVVYSCAMGVGEFREPGMGMKFHEISEADRELIRNFIKGQLLKDITAPSA